MPFTVLSQDIAVTSAFRASSVPRLCGVQVDGFFLEERCRLHALHKCRAFSDETLSSASGRAVDCAPTRLIFEAIWPAFAVFSVPHYKTAFLHGFVLAAFAPVVGLEVVVVITKIR